MARPRTWPRCSGSISTRSPRILRCDAARVCCAPRRRRTSPASSGCTGSTITWCRPTRSTCLASALASCAIKGTDRALAMSVDGNGRYGYLDPRRGAMLAVAEASRNVACAGARPLAATNCLNFGNPGTAGDHVAVRRGRRRDRRGVPRARRADHRRQRQPVQRNRRHGDLSDADHRRRRPARARRPCADTAIPALRRSRSFCSARDGANWAAANTWTRVHDLVRGVPPALDLAGERALQSLLVELATERLIRSAHDCSDGGLAVTLAECCFGTGGIGRRSVDWP